MQIKLRTVKNFNDIHNSEADLSLFEKKVPKKKAPRKINSWKILNHKDINTSLQL